jgi:hypothetical protein
MHHSIGEQPKAGRSAAALRLHRAFGDDPVKLFQLPAAMTRQLTLISATLMSSG